MPLTVKRHKKRKIPSHSSKKKIRQRRKKIPGIKLEIISNAWDNHKSAKTNLENMGLVYDPNKAVTKKKSNSTRKTINASQHSKIACSLEKEAKAPRVRKFKFPNPQAIYFTYLIKTYGDDYKKMAKDPKNVYQETWKKIRSRISQFKKLEQYKEFMYGNK